MHKHREQHTLTGIVKEPGPDESHGDDRERIGCKGHDIEGTLQNGSGNEVGRKMP